MCVRKFLSVSTQRGLFNVSRNRILVWLGADGSANLGRRAPTGFRLSSLSTAPHLFKETALLQDNVGGICIRELQTENAISHCGTLLLFSSSPLTPVPAAVESMLCPG
ncbi:hypothetical protein PoB_006049300 [Plakobranchus ocellatus]|uniref:Uncharacterized protein n=1 Tax=Plakobranchus ocellatus TaxID=259542 RepID=A0AAV4CQ25_9GAST|nr:hypothetical protein PoB_006049300 [Plakobranchus ocellatus]